MYSVVWGARFPKQTSQLQICIFLGMMGAANTVLLWPPCLLIGGPGLAWEPWELNIPHGSQWSLVMTMAALAVLSNFSYMLGISLTSPTFMAVGSIVQLPLAALADRWLHDRIPTAMQIGGYVAISVGFLVLVHENYKLRSKQPSTETST